jgi:hypothetical protein
MDKDNHHMREGNEELGHAIVAIDKENDDLIGACKNALDDLRKLEEDTPDKDLHHKNELRKHKKLL